MLMTAILWTGCRESAPEAPPEPPAPSAGAVEVPDIRRFMGTDQKMHTMIDEAGFSRACVSLELPVPPSPTELEFHAFTRLHQFVKDLAAQPSAAAYGNVGAVYFANALRDHAAECYERARMLAPEDPQWSHLLARLNRDLGQKEKALELARKATAAQPAYPESFALLGDLQRSAGQLDAARKAYATYRDRRPAEAYAHFGLGRVAFDQQDYEAACEHLQKALSLAKDEMAGIAPKVQIRYLYGQALQRAGRVEMAAPFLNAATSATPLSQMTFQDALFLRVHEIAESTLFLRMRFQKQMAAGRVQEAIDVGTELLRRRPSDVDNLQMMAALFRKARANEQARELLERATRLQPANGQVSCGLVEVYLALRQPQLARQEAKRTVGREPRMARAQALLGAACLALEEWDAAEAALQNAIATAPKVDTYHFLLGQVLERQSRTTEAIAAYERSLELNPQSIAAEKRLAELCTAPPP